MAELTPNSVVMQLASLGRELDEAVERLAQAEQDAVNLREDYTLAQARAFLRAEGAMDFRKHRAIEQTHAERLAAETAEAVVRGLRRQIDSIKTRIDIGRSVGVALRAEIDLTGRGTA